MPDPRTVRAMIRELIAATDLTDWREIADKVISDLDPAEYEDALREVLPSYVRSVAMANRKPGPVMTVPPKAVPDGKLPPDEPRKHVSSKMRAIGADWQDRLREIYPAADGTNKHLANMNYADLQSMADRLRRQARQTMARANGWTELANALKLHKVNTVADLPMQVAERLVKAA